MAGNMSGCWGMMCKYSKKSIVTKKNRRIIFDFEKKEVILRLIVG